MGNNCKICNAKPDLFSACTMEGVCAICKLNFIGGLPTTEERISVARERLSLKEGEFLQQDCGREAAKILGRC